MRVPAAATAPNVAPTTVGAVFKLGAMVLQHTIK